VRARCTACPDEFLADKPRFREWWTSSSGFVSGAELIIHNAPFDVSFLDRELDLIDRPGIGKHCPQITDTLRMARELNPGKRANLDALCERYQIDKFAAHAARRVCSMRSCSRRSTSR